MISPSTARVLRNLGLAVEIEKHLTKERFNKMQNRYDIGRITDEEFHWFLGWIMDRGLWPTWAPPEEWSFTLPNKGYMVGRGPEVKTFLSKRYSIRGRGLDEWWSSLIRNLKAEGKIASFLTGALAALDGTSSPMDMDPKGIGESPSDLDL